MMPAMLHQMWMPPRSTATRWARASICFLSDTSRAAPSATPPAATIDALSNGRLTLGVALGARKDDYDAAGVDYHARGRRLSEQLAALRAHPKRLRGTAIFRRPMERFELEAMGRDGFVGVRLPFIGLPALPDITTFDYRSLFRRLADLDWHVHPHVRGEDLPKILPTLQASGVKIVVDHLGRPDPKSGINSEGFKALLRSIDKGRTWVKLSGGYRLGPQAKQYARELLRVAGPDRLVWASDCPFVGHEGQFPYRATMDWLVEAIPEAGARAKIFGATARELYFNGE